MNVGTPNVNFDAVEVARETILLVAHGGYALDADLRNSLQQHTADALQKAYDQGVEAGRNPDEENAIPVGTRGKEGTRTADMVMTEHGWVPVMSEEGWKVLGQPQVPDTDKSPTSHELFAGPDEKFPSAVPRFGEQYEDIQPTPLPSVPKPNRFDPQTGRQA